MKKYFQETPTSHSDKSIQKKIDGLLQLITHTKNESIKSICSNSLTLQLVCEMWLNRENHYDLLKDQKKIKPDFYEDILLCSSTTYLIEHRGILPKNISPLGTYIDCRNEIAFTEQFAFLLTHTNTMPDGVELVKRFLKDKKDMLKTQEKLGFIFIDPNYWSDNHPLPYFPESTLQHFFCARFLISSLHSHLTSEQIQFSTAQQTDEISGVPIDKYLQLKSSDESYQAIWEFIDELLYLYHDTNTLHYFIYYKTGQYPQLKDDQQLITELAKKQYEFDLKRVDPNTIIISYIQSMDDLLDAMCNLSELKKRLTKWLTWQQLSSEVKISTDQVKPVLTIKSDTTELIDNVLSWLIQLTNTLSTQPMQTQKAKSPSFFAQPQSSPLPKVGDVAQQMECKLQ